MGKKHFKGEVMKKVFLAFLVFFGVSYSHIPACVVSKGICVVQGYKAGGDTPDVSWTGMVYNDSCTVVYGVSIANTLTICNGKEEKRLL